MEPNSTKERTSQRSDDPRRFFWRLLLAASIMAAAVSLLTTGLGLDRYVSFVLAWTMALAVQLGLFGLAWLIGVGQGVSRGWISALYCVTMLFSVTFSYVTLQSEFTKEIRPAEARRALFDLSRDQLAEASRLINEGLQESSELQLRLASWVDMERRAGWATGTCEEEEHCYLQGVCDRILRRIDRWQSKSGKTYRQGPGEQLIFGTLETELQAVEQLGARLADYKDVLDNGNGVLDDGLENRQRLQRLDRVLNQLPAGDLEAVTCDAVAPLEPPSWGDHARDAAAGDEQPVYAFEDLLDILRTKSDLRREDYPTLFALALALFIDLFVLVVALGASTVAWRNGVPATIGGVPRSFEDALQRDIRGWIDAALLGRSDPRARQDFLSSMLEAITFGGDGDARLIPENEEQRRFGHLLAQSQAAHVESFVRYNRAGRLFRLEEWVYPALARHLAEPLAEAPAGVS